MQAIKNLSLHFSYVCFLTVNLPYYKLYCFLYKRHKTRYKFKVTENALMNFASLSDLSVAHIPKKMVIVKMVLLWDVSWFNLMDIDTDDGDNKVL